MKTPTQELIVLTSPPASGKTFWINCLKNEFSSTKILVISPLRALADECRAMWADSVTVMTPEEWVKNKVFHEIIIFDEFHLFFYWGDTFRPLMWEMFYEVSQTAHMTFLLTATLSNEMRTEIGHFQTQFEHITWINHGNRILKFKPFYYLKAPSKSWLLKLISNQAKGHDVKLIFCEYRQEVLELEKKLSSLGFNCISCIGGESRFMASRLKLNPQPDFIISTTVLSHGVNLPNISKIYLTYKINNIDFWIQMVARGGRRGEKYSVYALECPMTGGWNSWINILHLFWESVKLKFLSSSFLFPKS